MFSFRSLFSDRRPQTFRRSPVRPVRPSARPGVERLEDRLAPAGYLVTPQLQVVPTDNVGGTGPARQVVFLESSVADYQLLRQAVPAGTDAVVLSADGDGVAEMAAFLAGRHDLSAIHLVAHGTSGAVYPGTATLDAATLPGYAKDLAVIGKALAPGGGLDLWSCDVASGETGKAFVGDLAQAVGRGLAASSRPVGSAAQGGVWQLDDVVGQSPPAAPFNPAALAQFPTLLEGVSNPTGNLTDARNGATATLLGNGKVLVAGGSDNTGYVATADLYDPSTGAWTSAGSMSSVRYGQTATLLGNGKVLMAGGYNGGGFFGYVASTDLYDPSTGTWTPAASMTDARYQATATLLGNGMVLVAGGANSNGATASAELYDPSSGQWTVTGGMTTARLGATATLLANGKVLVVGGNTGGTVTSAELYDPSTGMWTATGSIPTLRFYQTATLLGNGMVLVAGGYDSSNNPVSTVELYDPNTGVWTATGSLNTARKYLTATLLSNGKVLVAGGEDSNLKSLSSMELYDPETGVWTLTGSMTTARAGQTATLLGNAMVLLAGGFNSSGDLNSTELFNDPVASTWTPTGSLSTGRNSQTATLLANGKVLVAGGIGGVAGYLASAELYDPSTGAWTSARNMTTARYYATATLLANGMVLVAGGYNSPSGVLASAELFDPTTGRWTATGNMTTARSGATATLLGNGMVLVAGGYSATSNLSSAELYNPSTGRWTSTSSMTTTRFYQTATLLANGMVLVAGGLGDSGYLSSAELYDPTTGRWTPTTGSLNTARYSQTATLLGNGKVLVAGGYDSNANPLSSVELYDPTTGRWTAANSMSTARLYQTATLLANGMVLVAGGQDANFNVLASAELYDPTTGRWTAAGSMSTTREQQTATLLGNGKVLLVGGGNDSNNYLASAELYDPAAGVWAVTGPLAAARNSQTATLLGNGKVLLAGGSSALARAELYDPLSNASSFTGSMTTPRYDQTATLLGNGMVLVAGGFNSNGDLKSAELYDPSTGVWTATGNLNTARYHQTATPLGNGMVLVVGGLGNSGILASAELYDPSTGLWSLTGNLTTARFGATATLLANGKVLVSGGEGTSSILASAELYDPKTGAWTSAGNMTTARAFQTATLLGNGKVLLAGGEDGSFHSATGAELYTPDPASGPGTWSATGAMTSARAFQTATLLSNGQVLLAGGQDGNFNPLASAELYDPVAGVWSPAGSMAAARYTQTATRLGNGLVLIAGGANGGVNALASAELFGAADTMGPGGVIATDTPLFSWLAVPGAVSYDVYVVDQTSGQNPLLFLKNLTQTSVHLSAAQALTPGHAYTWYLGTVGSSGAITWNSPLSFSVAALAAPTPIGPGGAIAAAAGFDTPTFTWSSVTGASLYYLYVVDTTTGVLIINNTTITTTSFTAGAGLTPGHNFRWFVASEGVNGGGVSFSGPKTFTLAAMAAPTQNGPEGSITAATGYDTPTFSWSSVAGASLYYLYVVDTTTGVLIINNTTIAATSFTASAGLTPGHSFRWFVASEGVNGGGVSFSGPKSFTLAGLAAPTQNGPEGSITAATGYDTPTFRWSSVAGASLYYLYVVDTTTGVLIINNMTITTTSFTASAGLTPGHSFRWFVASEGVNGGGVSFSGPKSFTLAALAAPAQNGPEGNIAAAAGYDTPTFTWSSVVGASLYYLYVVDATTGVLIINNATITTSSFTPSTTGVLVINNAANTTTSFTAGAGLTPGHSFRWFVASEGVNGGGVSFSGPKSFTLAALAAPTQNGPEGNIAAATGYDTPTFRWSSVAGASLYYLYVVDTTTGVLVINNTTITTASFTAGAGLTPGHSFRWFVASEGVNGGGVSFSGSKSFTLAALAAPTQNGPEGNIAAAAGYDTPTFRWSSVAGASLYYLYVVDATTGVLVINNTAITTTSFTPSTPLTRGHSFRWFVASEGVNGGGVAFSGPESFTLAP